MKKFSIRSMPLQPAGKVARRDNLAVLVKKAPSYKQRSADAVEVSLVRITGLTREGEIRTYRPVAPESGHDHRVELYWREIVGFADASMLDPERAIEIARAHTWPGHPDSPMPWESMEDARDALHSALSHLDPDA